MQGYATFDVTSAALLFERAGRELGYDVRLTPVPRVISASCGLSCKYPPEAEPALKAMAEERSIPVAGWHCLER